MGGGSFELCVGPEQRQREEAINDATKRFNEACKQAKKHNPRVDDSEMAAFFTGKTVIVCCGPVNSGKSSFLNSMITGRENSGMFRTNIKAETCDATMMEFGPVYRIEGKEYPDWPSFLRALSLAQQSTRKAGTGTPEVIHAQVATEGLCFNGGGTAAVLDTPGMNESAKDGGASMETFVGDLIKRYGTNVVLLYFLPLDRGISTSYGEALRASVKEFLKMTGVAGARLIVVCSKYDVFVDEQQVDADVSDINYCDGYGAAQVTPDDKMQLEMAMESFNTFRRLAVQELATHGMPGVAFLPYARLDEKKAKGSSLTHEARRAQMQCIYQEIATRAQWAQRDTQTARWFEMRNEINKRISGAAGTGLSATFVSECMAAAEPELDRMDAEVRRIVERAAEEVKGLWVRQHAFVNALVEKTCDPVQETVNAVRQSAQEKAVAMFSLKTEEMVRRLDLEESTLSIAHASGKSLLHGFGGNMLATYAVLAVGLIEEAAVIDVVASFVAAGAGAAILMPYVAAFTALSAAFSRLRWTYPETIEEVTKLWLDRVQHQKLVFSRNLRSALEAEAQAVAASIAAASTQTEDLLKPLHKEFNDMYDSLVGSACPATRP